MFVNHLHRSCLMACLFSIGLLNVTAIGQEKVRPGFKTASSKQTTDSGIVKGRGEVVYTAGTDVRCEVPGTNVILQVVPEGTKVEAGDFLIELDSSSLDEALQQKEIELTVAKADLQSSKERLALLQKSWENQQRLFGLFEKTLNAEKEALLGNDGKLVLERKQVEVQIQRHQKRLELAMEARKQFFSSNADEKIAPLEIELEIADAQAGIEENKQMLRYLQGAHREKEIARFEFEYRSRKSELENRLEESKADYISAHSDQEAIEMRYDRMRREFEQIKQQIEKCRIVAPAAGTVIYANDQGRRGLEFFIEPGAQVRERQTLIRLPETDKVGVNLLIGEHDIAQVAVGQAAIVKVDALATQSFKGVVNMVARFPEPIGWRQEDSSKKYRVLVAFEDPPENVRQGMTATVEIKVNE